MRPNLKTIKVVYIHTYFLDVPFSFIMTTSKAYTKVSSQINNATFMLDDAGKPSRQEEEEETKEETLRELERILEHEGLKLQYGVEELEVINLNEGEGVKEICLRKLIPPDVK
ncbi:hypothetical protein CR513_29202, partial [Mucuna pruriens]